ncbi:MAG TPA: efflux RND transporter periplasmic adaptor subunit [Bacteroidia bacterium]|nr:efflux RND transporter periplasmic adaptor subunit [Bacteroidia bacterium]HNT80476.1 efflux RND transporter periplasmic adaptor subunit [Bacteroidia bacterium]
MKNILLLFIIAAVALSCNSSQSNDKEAELSELLKQQSEINDKIRALKEELKKESPLERKRVSVTEVKPELFQRFVEVQAMVDGDESVSLSPRMAGTIESVNVKAGDRVNEGQVLATMDAAMLIQSLEEVKVQLDLARSLYEKQANLWKQKIGSEVQYLTAKTNKESLEKRYQAVKEQVELSKIIAPISGTIDQVNVKVGQAVAPGIPVMQLVNMNKLKVVGELPEAYVSKVKNGDKVLVEFPDIPLTLNKKISYSGKVINPINRTFNVEVRLDAKDGKFVPNMIAVMKIADYENKDALLVPLELVQNSPNGKFIFVAVPDSSKNLIAKRKFVQTGIEYNGMVEISDGLNATEKIVSTGFLDLAEGDLLSESKNN